MIVVDEWWCRALWLAALDADISETGRIRRVSP
jgi:hypothetical protein